MTRDSTELREAITQSRVGQTRWRCPVKLRDEIVGFAQERRREGVSVMKVAKELGVSESGLNRWLQKSRGATSTCSRDREAFAPRAVGLDHSGRLPSRGSEFSVRS